MKIEGPRLEFDLKPDGAESLGLEALSRLGEHRLLEEDVLRRASRSSLYRRRWKGRDIKRAMTGNRENLRYLPLTDRRHIFGAQQGRALRTLACGPIWMWFASSLRGDERIWIPYGRGDVLRFLGLLTRLSSVCELEHGDRVLAIPAMAPRIANALPYLWMYSDIYSARRNLEFITGSTYMLGRSDWPEFALRRKPSVLLAQADDAIALSEYYMETASAAPREILPSLKRGIFTGTVSPPRRKELKDSFDLEVYTCFLSVEFPGLFAECRAHDGCHVWMDVCIPELIPAEKTAYERERNERLSGAVFLDQADAGMKGELVLTTFGEVLPLVRYRTGRLIKVVSVSPCSCGITHPRIEFLGTVL